MAKQRQISEQHGPITQRFLDDAEAYQLRFLCEDCAFFNDETEECVHTYPNQPHRREYFANEPLGKVLIFCRDFELIE